MYFWDGDYHEFCGLSGKRVSRFVYSHGAVKIRDIADYSGDMARIVKESAANICAWFGARKNISGQDGRMIANDVYYKFGSRLSIFGLLHCLNLIEDKEPPCDIEMFGFKVEDISRCIGRYVAHCQQQYALHLHSLEDKGSLAANMAGLAKAIDKAPAHVREKWDELRQKQDARDQMMKKPIVSDEKHAEDISALVRMGVLKPGEPSVNDFD